MNIKGYLIYPATTPRTNNAFGWFCDAAMHHGISLEVLFYDNEEDTDSFKRLPLPDFVFMRGYNILLSEWYESQGVMVLNSSESMSLCRDKYRTSVRLRECGVSTPDFSMPFSSREILAMGYDALSEGIEKKQFIIKQIYGSKGDNVYLVSDERGLEEAMASVDKTLARRLSDRSLSSEYGASPDEIAYGCRVIVQRYINESYGKDIRVWTFGGEVIGHILRFNDNSFKSNFAQGGSFREVELPVSGRELAVDASKALGLTFSGVDLLYTSDETFTVCEVNGAPGFRTAPTDIPEEIFRVMSARKF